MHFGGRRDAAAVALEGAGHDVEQRDPDALRNEESSLKSQFVGIQRAIEAIEGAAAPTARPGRKKAVKTVGRRKRTMTEEQRRAVAERMRKYWAERRAEKATAN